MSVDLRLGDCLSVMAELPENSVDTILTDPPYGLTFMGKDWDRGVPGVAFWREALRVAKPGAMLLAMGGTRTFHRLVVAIEDAGFEIRDTIAWVYGSGFPKSYDISKGIDKVNGETGRLYKFTAWMRTTGLTASAINEITDTFMGSHYLTDKSQPAIPTRAIWSTLRPYCGDIPKWVDELVERIEAEREVVGSKSTNKTVYQRIGDNNISGDVVITAPATPSAQLWHGWGTALKPAMELICVAMKPIDGTFVNNALTWGVAGLWIDGGRVKGKPRTTHKDGNFTGNSSKDAMFPMANIHTTEPDGRFPANVIHDGSDEVMGLFPMTKSGIAVRHNSGGNTFGGSKPKPPMEDMTYGDSGSAARFFYCAKASRSERNAGLEGMPEKQTVGGGGMNNTPDDVCDKYGSIKAPAQNHHPTVKPLALMRYLARLTKTPTGGVVLDPFMGSGTTGMAAVMEGRDFIGIELNAEYLEIAEKRIAHAQGSIEVELPLFAEAVNANSD